MPNKRASRNAYFFFVLDMIPELRRRGLDVSGVKDAIPLCSGDWALLSPEDKEKYAEKAKEWKNDPKPANTQMNNLFSSRQAKDSTFPYSGFSGDCFGVNGVSSDQSVFYFLNIFSHGEMPSLCEQRFVPCEIGCVRYSLHNGIMGNFHDFIDPGELPHGFRYHCQAGSAASHQIPISGFELANGDYHKLFRNLCEFVCATPYKRTPVFSKANEIYRIEWCLQWLARKAGMENIFELLDVESLIIKLFKEKLQDEPSRPSVCRLLEVVQWDYANDTRCNWHEQNDMWCCALASCKKVAYCISKALASVYGITLTSAHLPSLDAMKEQNSGSPKVVVLDANRFQKCRIQDNKYSNGNVGCAGASHDKATTSSAAQHQLSLDSVNEPDSDSQLLSGSAEERLRAATHCHGVSVTK
ncbi:protein maelstrom homolog [Rhinophrynus dorsalis]